MIESKEHFDALKNDLRILIAKHELAWVSVSYNSTDGPGVLTIEKGV